jgi:hypothetical protein
VIAAYLAGIYAELKRANDLRSTNDAGAPEKAMSSVDEKE